MILGKDDYVVRNFPKGVLATSFNSKLISSSDNVNFTYKGRFTDAQQAATIGYEATQKAHNALTWVVANQGIFIDGRAFVCWDPSGCHVPLLESKVVKRPYEDDEEHEIKTFTTPSDYKADLQKALSGWRQHLPDQEMSSFRHLIRQPKVVFQSFITTNSKAPIFLTDSSFGRNIVSGKTVYSVTNLRRYGKL